MEIWEELSRMNLTRLCLGKPCRRHVRKEQVSVCGDFELLCRGLGCPQPAFQNIRKGYSETLLAVIIGTFCWKIQFRKPLKIVTSRVKDNKAKDLSRIIYREKNRSRISNIGH